MVLRRPGESRACEKQIRDIDFSDDVKSVSSSLRANAPQSSRGPTQPVERSPRFQQPGVVQTSICLISPVRANRAAEASAGRVSPESSSVPLCFVSLMCSLSLR